MKEAYVTLTYLITITEEEIGECLTEEEFKARTNRYVDEKINEMGVFIPNDVEIEFREGE